MPSQCGAIAAASSAAAGGAQAQISPSSAASSATPRFLRRSLPARVVWRRHAPALPSADGWRRPRIRGTRRPAAGRGNVRRRARCQARPAASAQPLQVVEAPRPAGRRRGDGANQVGSRANVTPACRSRVDASRLRRHAEQQREFGIRRGNQSGVRPKRVEHARAQRRQLGFGLGQQQPAECAERLVHGVGRAVLAVLVELAAHEPPALRAHIGRSALISIDVPMRGTQRSARRRRDPVCLRERRLQGRQFGLAADQPRRGRQAGREVVAAELEGAGVAAGRAAAQNGEVMSRPSALCNGGPILPSSRITMSDSGCGVPGQREGGIGRWASTSRRSAAGRRARTARGRMSSYKVEPRPYRSARVSTAGRYGRLFRGQVGEAAGGLRRGSSLRADQQCGSPTAAGQQRLRPRFRQHDVRRVYAEVRSALTMSPGPARARAAARCPTARTAQAASPRRQLGRAFHDSEFGVWHSQRLFDREEGGSHQAPHDRLSSATRARS